MATELGSAQRRTFDSADAPQTPPLSEMKSSKKEALEQELKQQKRTLAEQREEYFKRRVALTRELYRLKEQKRELLKEDSKNKERILKKNSKLQGEILLKLKSMDNVFDALSNIIGDKAEIAELMKSSKYAAKSPKKGEKRKRSSSRSQSHKKAEKGKVDASKQVNIVHYDPELHWCSICEIFPRTASDYLTHLHSEQHSQAVKSRKGWPEEEVMPWRVHEPRDTSPPVFKNAPSRRVPIRGVKFLVPTSAWYCSLCKSWLGDMDVANKHLRGTKHATNLQEMNRQNPHWEIDWLTERARAYKRNSEAKSARFRDERPPLKKIIPLDDLEVPSAAQPSFDFGHLSDRLLAMIAATSDKMSSSTKKSKKRSKSNRSNSSSSKSTSERRKDKKKKKKKYKEREKKKAAQHENLSTQLVTSVNVRNHLLLKEEPSPKLKPEEMSELALLGIEEGNITA